MPGKMFKDLSGVDDLRPSIFYPNDREVDLAYFASGALESVEDSGASTPIAEYEYVGSRVLKRSMDNGVDFDMTDGSGGTHFDAAGRPLQWRHLDTNQQGDPVLVGFEYKWDSAGNKLWQKSVHDAKDSQKYSYDSSGRLSSYVRGGISTTADDRYCAAAVSTPYSNMVESREWTLDGVGNWSSVKTKDVGQSPATETRLDTNFNEYYEIGSTSQSHDDYGNLTDDGTWIWGQDTH